MVPDLGCGSPGGTPCCPCGGPFSSEAAQEAPADASHDPLRLDCSFRMICVWLSTYLNCDLICEYPGGRKASWEMPHWYPEASILGGIFFFSIPMACGSSWIETVPQQ